MKKLFFVIMTTIFFCSINFGQKNDTSEVKILKDKMEKLELQMLKDSIIREALREGFDYKSEIENFKIDIKKENEQFKFDIKSETSIIKIITALLGGVTLISIIGAIIHYFSVFRKRINQLVDQKIKTLDIPQIVNDRIKLIVEEVIAQEIIKAKKEIFNIVDYQKNLITSKKTKIFV